MNAAPNLEDVIDMDQAIGLTDAAKRMRGRGGKPPSVETVRRWANPKKGCRPQGQAGQQLLLMTVRVNGELLTLADWVDAFELERRRLGARRCETTVMPERSPKRREAAFRRAEKELDRKGIGGKG